MGGKVEPVGERRRGLRKKGNAPQIWIRATGKGNLCIVVALLPNQFSNFKNNFIYVPFTTSKVKKKMVLMLK